MSLCTIGLPESRLSENWSVIQLLQTYLKKKKDISLLRHVKCLEIINLVLTRTKLNKQKISNAS